MIDSIISQCSYICAKIEFFVDFKKNLSKILSTIIFFTTFAV